MNDSVTIYEEEEYADFKELILYQNYLLGLTISDGIWSVLKWKTLKF